MECVQAPGINLEDGRCNYGNKGKNLRTDETGGGTDAEQVRCGLRGVCHVL